MRSPQVNQQAQANSSRRIRGVTKIGALTSIGVAAIAASLPLAAHHSFSAEFDASKEIRATGAVTKLDWQNPHAWIHMTVTEICERTAARGPDAVEQEWACRAPGGDEKERRLGFRARQPERADASGLDAQRAEGRRRHHGSRLASARRQHQLERPLRDDGRRQALVCRVEPRRHALTTAGKKGTAVRPAAHPRSSLRPATSA